ncbi:MAG: hypothetical protein OXD36_14825 [Rhodobacter sp.]|nr:hypothetical protein [Rhodobacter sp.]
MSPLDTYNAEGFELNIKDIVLSNDFLDPNYIQKRTEVQVPESEFSQSFDETIVAELSSWTRNLPLRFIETNTRGAVPLQPLMNHEPNAFERREIKRQIRGILRDAGKDGWLNGDGTAVNADSLRWLEKNLIQYLSDQSIPIRLYPTEEGGVEVEYTIKSTLGNTEVSVEIDLRERKGYWHSFDFSNKSSEDQNLDLSLETGWEWLSKDFEKAKGEGIVNEPRYSTLATGSP